jgi:hypothetical protein
LYRRSTELAAKEYPFSELGNEVLRFRIDIQPCGACLLSTPVDAAVQFDSLTTALASARVTAADAEADIEIWMDGLYMFVHQPQGWPRRITH